MARRRPTKTEAALAAGRAYGQATVRPSVSARATRPAPRPRPAYRPPMPATERAPARPAPRPAPRPTPKQVESAKAIGRSYASQGRQLKTQARRQRQAAKVRQTRRERASRIQAREYPLQAKAIRRAALVQKVAGPGQAAPSPGRILHKAEVVPLAREKEYASQAKQIQAAATEQKAKGDVMYRGHKVSRATLLTDPKALKAAGFKPPGGFEKVVFKNFPKDVKETAIGTPTSIAHIASRQAGATVESVKKGSPVPLAKATYQTGKEIVEPYVELAEHPKKFASERPLTTALMIAPVAPAKLGRVGAIPVLRPAVPKVADVAAGRVARAEVKVAGRTIKPSTQTLRRPDATLPGTSMREVRVGSRRYSTRRGQAKQDVKQPAPTITVKERGTRVDEFVDRAQQQKQAMQHAAVRDTRKKLKGPQGREHAREVIAQRHDTELADLLEEKAERPREVSDQHIDELKQRHADERAAFDRRGGTLSRAERRDVQEARAVAAGGGARKFNDRQFAHEVGSDWRIDPTTRTLYKSPKGGSPEGSGQIHASREDAQRVADAIKGDAKVDWTPKIMEIRGDTPGETGGYAVVPSDMAARYTRHKRVGRGGFAVGPGLRVLGRQFRRTVLPTSVKWLAGQAIEGAVRGAVAGVTPASKRRWTRVLGEVERQETEAALKRGMSQGEAARHAKGAVREVEQGVTGGGLYGGTGFFGDIGKRAPTLAQQLSDPGDPAPKLIQKASELGQKPVVRHIRNLYGGAADFVFNDVNGRIEQFYKRGLAGKAVAQGPLMDKRLRTLSDAAVREAAEGLRNTSNMVQLAREVDRAYGKYSKYSPKMRDTLLHTSPFLPWMLNMGRFLGSVMPKDHPVMTSLTASMNEADREWRTKHRLSFYGKGHVPDFMMGMYPTKGGKFVPAARYMPFAPGEWAGALGSEVYPQISGAKEALSPGVTWKGQKIEGEERKLGAAAWTGGEALVPLLGQASRVTGFGDRYVLGQKKKPSVIKGDEPLGKALRRAYDPFASIAEPSKGGKRRRKRPSGGLGGGRLGGGGLGGGGLGGGGLGG